MSLNITIKQGSKKVYVNNFYGFVHFGESNRHELANGMNPSAVTNYQSYKDFIERSVEEDQQEEYLNLVAKNKPITILIH